MAVIEQFSDRAAVDLRDTDYFYLRASAEASGSRDRRFSFSSMLRSFISAANGPAARAAIGFLTNTAALDFPSINANAKADLTISVPGALVGDGVALGPPASPAAGLVFFAFVSSSDTVTVRASNTSAAPVDESSMTFRVVVFKSA